MIVNKIIGNIEDFDIGSRTLERLFLHYTDRGKRLIRGRTDKGTEIAICFEKGEQIKDGDIIYIDENKVIILEIQPIELISIKPDNMKEMAHICYILGNRHVSIFIDERENIVFTPFESLLWNYLKKFNFKIEKVKRKPPHALQLSGHHHH
ncbi:urease accessory protein UreE [Thermodesulfovibrio sp. Kuro-1]|uniref:urease accessory protein UreE n=1 Tax=Thermodesulfovibrio sp. Kuro-1 TaxID=2580394 RepID=UPI0015E86B53|nr:urease accessory protein UreE [Thermodesulfovibrio sp. Kuro-1]